MGSNIQRRQHYIPQMLLKNFCDGNGRLWVGYEERVFQTTPGNAFVERDLYTKSDFRHVPRGVGYQEFLNSITRTYEYEQRLSEIESIAEPAVQQILERARLGECPKLSASLGDAWKRFLLAIARRTPESQERVSHADSPEDIFYQAAAHFANRDNHPLPAKALFYRDTRILGMQEMVNSNSNARFATGDHPQLEKETKKFSAETGLCVAMNRIRKKGFVIGSHGLAIVRPAHRDDYAGGSWLPIANDVAVKVTPFPDREYLVILDRNNDGDRIISMINEASAAKSRMIAGRSEALIHSLLH